MPVLAVVAGTGCSTHRVVACSAALARPSVLVDVSAFAAAHPGARADLCPNRSTAPTSTPTPTSLFCTSFVVTTSTILVSPSPVPSDATPGHVRVFLTPGDDRLTVEVTGARGEGGTVVLTGHRAKGPCGGWLYDPVRLTATGVPLVAGG